MTILLGKIISCGVNSLTCVCCVNRCVCVWFSKMRNVLCIGWTMKMLGVWLLPFHSIYIFSFLYLLFIVCKNRIYSRTTHTYHLSLVGRTISQPPKIKRNEGKTGARKAQVSDFISSQFFMWFSFSLCNAYFLLIFSFLCAIFFCFLFFASTERVTCLQNSNTYFKSKTVFFAMKNTKYTYR